MAKVLQVLKTGELFRLVDQRLNFNHVKDGARVECLNALIWKGRGRSFKRIHDKTVIFTWDGSRHRIVETTHDIIDEWERLRAKQLLCWKYHPQLCDQKPYEEKVAPVYKSIVKDREHWIQELLRLSQLSLDYLESPGKFDRTRVSSLRFELKNVVDFLKKLHGDGGMNGGETGSKTTPS